MAGLSLERFIYQVKDELLEAQRKHKGEVGYFVLQSVQLDVTLTTTLEGDGKVSVAVAELSSNIAKENTHTVRLVFSVSASGASEASAGGAGGAAKGPAGGGDSGFVGDKKGIVYGPVK